MCVCMHARIVCVKSSEKCFKDNICLLSSRTFENYLEFEGATINILLLYQGELGLGTSLSPLHATVGNAHTDH